MKDKISVILVGLGGYANNHLHYLWSNLDEDEFTIPAFVSSSLGQGQKRLPEIQARGIPIYRSLEELCANHKADLAIISSPIHLHAEHTCLALGHGMNVLCEKPTAGVVQESEKMKEARDRAGRFVAIAYNLSYTTNIQQLKKDILAGDYGQALRFKTYCLWPRHAKYYSRNRWAAKVRGEGGEWILDSPVHNATAHYLHNMLYLLGDRVNTSARPVSVQAELYRANRIENYDTGALRVKTGSGAEVLFFSSHAVEENEGPVFECEFEKGRVVYGVDGINEVRALMNDGTEKNYGPFEADEKISKRIWHCFDCIRTGAEPICGLEAAEAQLICVNGAQESCEVMDFPAEIVKKKPGEGDNGDLTFAEGLNGIMKQCWAENRLPSEGGVPWARAGREIDLRGYRSYPSRKS